MNCQGPEHLPFITGLEFPLPEAPSSSRNKRLKRGGPRNRADRVSVHLNKRQCTTLIDASLDALAIQQPFNRFITIAWGNCVLDRKHSVQATGEWITLAREYLRERGYSMPWAWVQEWGQRIGAHCHILLHVPPEMTALFRGQPEKWARKVVMRRGLKYVRGTMQTQKIWLSARLETDALTYRAALWGKVHYMLKCSPAELEPELGLVGWGHKPWGQSCTVYGKRLARWQSKRPVKVDPAIGVASVARQD